MAIKVKHEGNATSRLMASGAGGKGRRRAEDAKLFLQVASQENMANRKVAEPRMIQAHAQGPSSAPLVQAHAGGNAPLMGAPGIPQPHPYYGGGGGRGGLSPVTSPGGFKKDRRGGGGGGVRGIGGGGQPAGAAGNVGNLVQIGNGKNPKWQLQDAEGHVLKTYTKGELESVRRRGNDGAELDEYDSQAFFRDAGGKTDRELAEEAAQEERNNKIAIANVEANARDAELQKKLDAEKERRKEEFEREKEMFDYKFTQAQKRELEEINQTMKEARESQDFNDEELADLNRQAFYKRLGLKPQPTIKEEPAKPNIQEVGGRKFIQNGNRWDPIDEPTAPQTAEQVFGGTYTDPQTGRRYGVDKSGKLYEVSGVDQQSANRQKFILDNIKNATDIDGNPLTGDALKEKINQLGEMYDATMGGSQAKPVVPGAKQNGVGAVAEPAGNDPLNVELPEGFTSKEGTPVERNGKVLRYRNVFKDGKDIGLISDDGYVTWTGDDGMVYTVGPDGTTEVYDGEKGEKLVEKYDHALPAPWQTQDSTAAAPTSAPAAPTPVKSVEEAKKKWGVK